MGVLPVPLLRGPRLRSWLRLARKGRQVNRHGHRHHHGDGAQAVS